MSNRAALYVPLSVRGKGPGDHAPCVLSCVGVLLVFACYVVPALLF